MKMGKCSEDVASRPFIARVDDANGTVRSMEKYLTQFCVYLIGGGTTRVIFMVSG